MKRYHLRAFVFVIITVLLFGCATQRAQTAFKPYDLNQEMQANQYTQKVDNFMVILDASWSMRESYSGQNKFDFARDIVSRMNQTIPDMNLAAGLRTFGQDTGFFSKNTSLIYGLAEYSKAGMEETLNAANQTGYTSPLAFAIDASSEDLKSTQGEAALIVVSDGKRMDNTPVEAAENISTLLGKRLCIYTVLIGEDPQGKSLMEQVSQQGHCGFSVNARSIASASGMADFVKKVFLVKVIIHEPLDSDGDGIPDDLDQCPNTPKGVIVDEKGCPLPKPKGAEVTEKGSWIFRGIMFDYNKWELKPEVYPILDEVVIVLKDNPTLRMEIQGHTDNVGSKAYNMKLSENRAKAVMDYLLEKGIELQRLFSTGYGFSMPMASNDTLEGRATNRRVEFVAIH